MPMPKATVATATSTRPAAKASWVWVRRFVAHAGVVADGADAGGAELGGKVVHVCPADAVDDAGFAASPADGVDHVSVAPASTVHSVDEVRPEEVADQHDRVFQV